MRASPALPEARITDYVRAVIEWNDRAGLMSRRSPEAVLTRVVRQSASLWELVRGCVGSDASFVDVGTGAGVPGMIWKLLSPDSPALLIERRERKAIFVERTVAVLGMRDVIVHSGDARDVLLEPHEGRYVIGTTFAVAAPAEAATLVRRFLVQGGMFATLEPVESSPASTSGLIEIASLRDPEGMLRVYRVDC